MNITESSIKHVFNEYWGIGRSALLIIILICIAMTIIFFSISRQDRARKRADKEAQQSKDQDDMGPAEDIVHTQKKSDPYDSLNS